MDLPAEAVVPSKNPIYRGPIRIFELSTKSVDKFVDFFSTLAPSHGLVRVLSLCRNIEQQAISFKFIDLNKRL
jgi:hypothetical protein